MVATNANVVAAMVSHVVVVSLVTDSEWLILLVYSSLQHRMDAAKSLLSGPLLPALKGAPMDIIYHSEIYDRSHESYQSAVEPNRKTRIFFLSR